MVSNHSNVLLCPLIVFLDTLHVNIVKYNTDLKKLIILFQVLINSHIPLLDTLYTCNTNLHGGVNVTWVLH